MALENGFGVPRYVSLLSGVAAYLVIRFWRHALAYVQGKGVGINKLPNNQMEGIGMFGGEERKRRAFVQKVEDLAGSLQMEFCKSSVSYLEKKYDHETAVKISAALANYVFRFGYVSPQHASDSGLMATVASERPRVLDSFSSIFKMNSTGVLILLGAAWSVNLTEFKRHMQALREDGFAQVGRNTPNVQRDLPPDDAVYMYELTTLPSPKDVGTVTPPSPEPSMYEQDDRETEKQLRGLDAAIERMRKKGTLPKR